MTHITGLVTNPDGTPFNGTLLMVPSAWWADDLPVPALMSNRRVNAPVVAGVVDATVESNEAIPWELTLVSDDGYTMIESSAIIPADGEYTIDMLAPSPSPGLAVYPNPGPQGPPGEVSQAEFDALAARVAALEQAAGL